MIRLSLLLILAFASIADAQTITVYAAPMPVYRQRAGLWLTAREDCDVTAMVNGKRVEFKASIDPTYVRGVLVRAVDPCECYGISDDGHALRLYLPREPMAGVTATPMTSPGWFTTPDGVSHACSVYWPASRSRPMGRGARIADAVTATGTYR